MSFSSINLLQTIAFVDLLAVGLIVPVLPSHVRALGGSYIEIGLLGSLYAAFQMGSGPLVGSLSDLKGRRSILISTLIVCSLAYTLIGFTKSVILVLFIRAILGLFKQTQLLIRAMVSEYEESEQKQPEIYGRMAAISGMGITLGPTLGGHLIESQPDHGIKYIAMLVGLCFFINAGLAYLLPRPCIRKMAKRKGEKIKKKPSSDNCENVIGVVQYLYLSLKQSVADLSCIDWATYWDVFMLKALIGFAMGIYYSNYVIYLSTVYALTPKYTGYIISLQGTVGSLSSFFIGRINNLYQEDVDYSLRNLHVFSLITMSLGGLILSQNIYMYIFFLIPLAVSNAVGRLTCLEMLLKRSSGRHHGSLIGASNSVRSLAGVGAPLAAGAISQWFGVSYAIYASFFSTFIGLCMSYYCRNYSSEEDHDSSDSDDKICKHYGDKNHKIKTE